MKSSFSWPGRPPAEMISRNVNRLLTSILDGRLKRGAFCTSTLDGRLKRGAFCTSTLDGRLKRGAFCTSTLDGTPKRGAFYTSTLDGTPKRGAFCTSTLDGRLKRDAFLCPRIGAYCIRPTFLTIKINGTQIRSTKRPCKGTGSTKGDQTHDFLSPTGPFDGAYAIRPYHATSKRDAFYTSYLVATPKRGAFCTSYLVATLKRGAFCTSYLVGALKGGAFCLFYSSFLALMQEKKQKKIKASGTPAKFAGYIIEEVEIARAFASSFSIVVFSSFIFLCLSSLFSSGRSSFRCSVMCAP